MPDRVQFPAFAKINLSLDVGDRLADGYHRIDTVMQLISLHDEVTVSLEQTPAPAGQEVEPSIPPILLTCTDPCLPTGEGNLASQAAALFCRKAGLSDVRVRIHIKKNIPVGAGLAGGSADAAAVFHALTLLSGADLRLPDLMKMGEVLGSDIPFCLVGQAAVLPGLPPNISKDGLSSTCARATATGTELSPLLPPASPALLPLLLALPAGLSLSTAEAYRCIDETPIALRPDNDRLEQALRRKRWEDGIPQMINVFETSTFLREPAVGRLKARMRDLLPSARPVLMSGTGPAVFCFPAAGCEEEKAVEMLQEENYRVFRCHTI